MKTLIVLFLLIIHVSILDAQTISWQFSMEEGEKTAQRENKLMVLDFWAWWCRPCLNMDNDVWRERSVRDLENEYVFVRYDLSSGFHLAAPYQIKSIPTMIITDSWGKILYRTSGYMNSSKTLQILKAFPTDISKINERLKLYFEDKTDPGKAIDVAIAYQEYCDTLRYPAKPAFISESYHFLQQAKKMCDKESDKELIERIQLYKSLNSVYKGSGKGSIKYIETKIGLENISESNKALAYYILVKGYLKLDNSKEAQKNYSSLQECDDCYAYVASLENNF